MEDLTLALVTLTSFVLLFVIAIFADRAGAENAEPVRAEQLPVREEAPRAVPAAVRGIDVA